MGNICAPARQSPRLWKSNLDKRILFIKDKSSEMVGFIYSFISSQAGVRSYLVGQWALLGPSPGHLSLTPLRLWAEHDPKCCEPGQFQPWPWHSLLPRRTWFSQYVLLSNCSAFTGVH